MKSTIRQNIQPDRPVALPCLMRDTLDNQVFMATAKRDFEYSGIALTATEILPIGRKIYVPINRGVLFTGVVELSNDN